MMNNYFPRLLTPRARRAITGAGLATLLISPALLFAQPTYCPATHAVDCTGDFIDQVEIVGTSLNNAATGCTGTQSLAVSAYPATGNTTATLQPGQTYTFNITTSNTNILSVWIDFNQDGNFDATEHTQVSLSTQPNVVNTASITIPAGAVPGLTGMRVRSRLINNPNGPGDACLQFGSGETEDYIIQLGTPVPCSGTPTAGSVTTTSATTCSGSTVKITASGMSGGGGITYQFEESNDNGVTDPWAPVVGGSGGTSSVYTTAPLTTSIYYRHKVTCTNSNLSATSTPIQITVSNNISSFPYTETFDNVIAPALPCGWTTLDNNGDTFTWHNEANTPNSPPNAMTYRYNFQGAADDWFFSPAFTFDASKQYLVSFKYGVRSASYPEKLEVRWGTGPTPAGQPAGNVIWRDTNLVNITYQTATASGFTPPANGTYYLSFHAFSDPNMWDIYVDDITVIELGPCSGAPVTGTVSAGLTALCNGGSTTLTALGATQGSGITYVWEESNDNGTNDPWTTAVGGFGVNGTTYTTPSLTNGIFYRFKVTCANGNQTATSASIGLTNTGIPCYCTSNLHGSPCSSFDNIDDVEIVGTTLNNANSGCNSLSGNAYSIFPSSGNTTASLNPGGIYTFNISTTANNNVSMWIDYNRNGVFEALEHTQIAMNSTPNQVYTQTITIPATAMTGMTGMRIRSSSTFTTNGPNDACTQFFGGETEDYFIQMGTATPCSGTPSGGIATATPTTTCLNGTSTIVATGATNGVIGLVYQWEESNDNGVNDPWTNVTGGSNPNLLTYTTPPMTSTKWYRLNVTCTSTSQTSASVPVEIVVGSLPCYCNTNLHTSNCTTTDNIASVSITNTGLTNQNSGCNGTAATPGYSVGTATTTLVRNQTYSINVTSNSNSTIELWIDLNRNGVFDSNLTEWKLLTPASTPGTAATTSFTIPGNAQLGMTAMRIRTINSASFSQATPASACNNFSSGETEDYIVTIAASSAAEQMLSEAVSVIPNPTTGSVTVQLPNALTPGTALKVFDANAREVYSAVANGSLSHELNLSHLANGLYLLQTTLDNQNIVKRIVIQK